MDDPKLVNPEGEGTAAERGRDSGLGRALEGFRLRLAAFGLGTAVRPILAPGGRDSDVRRPRVPVTED